MYISSSSATDVASAAEYFTLTHLDDALMTEQEIKELPKVWVIGGDGALGDIGFQNVSKVVLQNRPNVKMLMLDTQVYSNTGGQNSDSSTMLGGYDMNQFGVASHHQGLQLRVGQLVGILALEPIDRLPKRQPTIYALVHGFQDVRCGWYFQAPCQFVYSLLLSH